MYRMSVSQKKIEAVNKWMLEYIEELYSKQPAQKS
jgi:hypothetical protein